MRSVNEQGKILYKYIHMLTVSMDIQQNLYKWGISCNLHVGGQCVQFYDNAYYFRDVSTSISREWG